MYCKFSILQRGHSKSLYILFLDTKVIQWADIDATSAYPPNQSEHSAPFEENYEIELIYKPRLPTEFN